MEKPDCIPHCTSMGRQLVMTMLFQSNLAVSGTGTFHGDLVANADSYVAGLLEAPGGATIGDELEATGKSHFYGDVTMDTKLDVKGNSSFEGKVTFDDFVEFYEDVLVHQELYVQQNAYTTGRLLVNGTISSNEEAKVTGLISVESPIDVDSLADRK